MRKNSVLKLNIFPKFSFRLFENRTHTLTQASALLAITALLSNILGLARNLVFYRLIKPEQLDVYFASFRVADFLFNLLIFGAITSAFIPVISELLSHNKEEEAKTITNQMLSIATLFFGILGLVLSISMPWIIQKVVPGFDQPRLRDTIFLSRLMLIQTVFFSWSFILGGLLNGYRRFSSYSLAPLVYNLAIISGGLLASRYHFTVISYAVIAGAFLHFYIQYREAKQVGFRFKLDLHLSSKVKEILYLMLPRSISQGVGQFVLVVYTSLASSLQAGSIAIFSGMNDLQTAPTAIIGNSLATAALPVVSGLVTHKDWGKMNEILSKIIRCALYILLPSLALAFTLRAQIVRLYFGIGGASWQLTNIAITTFVCFLIGIIPAVLVAILARVFYAFKDTRTPTIISVSTAILGISVSYIGIVYYHFNVATLALAESSIALTQLTAYLVVLSKHQHLNLDFVKIGRSIIDAFLGSAFLAASTWGTLRAVDFLYRQTDFLSTGRTLALFAQTLIAAAVGIGAFLGYSILKEQEEWKWLKTRKFTQKT